MKKLLDIGCTRKFRDVAYGVIENKTMALITGQAGVGKTTAARQYAESGDTRCYFVTAYNLMRTSDYLNALLDAMVQYRAWTVSERLEQAIKEYEYKPGLTIVDEADLLSVEVLELVRSLHDATGAPVVFIGSKRFPGRLRKQGLDQLTSRLQFKADFAPMDLGDMRLALPDLDAEIVNLLHKTSKGNMRVLSMLLKNVEKVKEVHKLKDTTPEVIRAASVFMVAI